MNILDWLAAAALTFVQALVLVGVLLAINLPLKRLLDRRRNGRIWRQVVMLVLTSAAAAVAILTLPLPPPEDPPRDLSQRLLLLQILAGLAGGALAFSSTTFLGNALAGLMLRSVRAFRSGDAIRVGDSFGRVTELGLLHVEIQTEDRDLTTLPNLYLVGHPVTVLRSSGTIVSATVSLGYDVPRSQIRRLLEGAAKEAGLEEPFVQLTELGDFSVTYRAAGLLKNVKQLLSTRSELRKQMLDALHGAGIEIVSPTFMNTRSLSPDQAVIPEPTAAAPPPTDSAPEKVIFDKADEAESLEKLEQGRERLDEQLKALEAEISGTSEDQEKQQLKEKRDQLREARQRLGQLLDERRAERRQTDGT